MSICVRLSMAILGLSCVINVVTLVSVALYPAVRSVTRLLCRWRRIPLPERPRREDMRTAVVAVVVLAVIDAVLALYVTRSPVLALVAWGGEVGTLVVIGTPVVVLLARREIRRRTSGRAWAVRWPT
jgi:hypothetical protein